MQRKDFVDDRVEKLMIFSFGQPKGKNTDKGYRAYTMLKTSNSLQTESQRAYLNMRHELINFPPRPGFICRVGSCRFISRQSALIVWL